jgi:hypothetical protein
MARAEWHDLTGVQIAVSPTARRLPMLGARAHTRFCLIRLQFQHAMPNRMHGLDSIHEVQDDLLQLRLVAPHGREVFAEVCLKFYAMFSAAQPSQSTELSGRFGHGPLWGGIGMAAKVVRLTTEH